MEETQTVLDRYDRGYREVLKNHGRSKRGQGDVTVVTKTTGLIFRVEAYLEGELINAKEVSCLDLNRSDNKEALFTERYKSAHEEYMLLYLAAPAYTEMYRDRDEVAEEGEGYVIVTGMSENTFRTQAILNDAEVEAVETDIPDDLRDNEPALKAKALSQHKSLKEKYFTKLPFPANTPLRPLLKKMPYYAKSPMFALLELIVVTALVLWLVSILFCGKALPKILKGVAGKEAVLVYKDFQKMICIKARKEAAAEEAKAVEEKIQEAKGGPYRITPELVVFTQDAPLQRFYATNNQALDLTVRIKDVILDDFPDPTVTGDMLISVVGPLEHSLTAQKSGGFDLKLETTFVKPEVLKPGEYKGRIIMDVFGVPDTPVVETAIAFQLKVGE